MSSNAGSFKIGIPIYPDFDPLDVVGPFEVFSWLNAGVWNRKVEVFLVGESLRPVGTFNGLSLTPVKTFEGSKHKCPPLDLVFVPGGNTPGLTDAMKNKHLLRFLERHAEDARFVTSVCTGALILASAGLLDGFTATTHWSVVDCLKLFPRVKVVNGCPRYVVDGNRVTGAGISSGLDMALELVAMITGDDRMAKQVQLNIQYNPHPRFDAGDPCVADYDTYNAVHGTGKGSFEYNVCRAVREIVK